MATGVRKKEGESVNSLIYRFTKKVQQSGILREYKKRRFTSRRPNFTKIKQSKLYKLKRTADIERARKLGVF
jgi:ribosomal protein S21